MKKKVIIIILVLIITSIISSIILSHSPTKVKIPMLPESCNVSYECGTDSMSAGIEHKCISCKKIINRKSRWDKIISYGKVQCMAGTSLYLNPNTRECTIIGCGAGSRDLISEEWIRVDSTKLIGDLIKAKDSKN